MGKRVVLRFGAVVAAGVLAVGAAGCQLVGGHDNLVNGKQKFVEACGACHVLERAGTTGVSGPDLDAALVLSLIHI